MSPTVHELLKDHVTLSVSCVDRLYINGYLPKLQRPGQLAWFLGHHLGARIPSLALLKPVRDRFVASVRALAQRHEIPKIPFERGQRKDDVRAITVIDGIAITVIDVRLVQRDLAAGERVSSRGSRHNRPAAADRAALGWCAESSARI